jgi:S-adenosylmethionine:tRNA ribosyltransferase-isomerase
MLPDAIPILTYGLPEDRIATEPLAERDASRLLFWDGKRCQDHVFRDLPDLLPSGAVLVLNETRTAPVRLVGYKPDTGGRVEVLGLKPVEPFSAWPGALAADGRVVHVWEALVGNVKRWKPHSPLHLTHGTGLTLTLELQERRVDGTCLVALRWQPREWSLAQVLERFGKMPIPPYMRREAVAQDANWYQTVFAREVGSVAAPTASLHFTEPLLAKVREKFTVLPLVLHVGLGTFQPVSSTNVVEHTMHAEQFAISTATLEVLADHAGAIVGVGTTVLRTLETAYWLGVQAAAKTLQMKMLDEKLGHCVLGQWPHREIGAGGMGMPREAAFEALATFATGHGLSHITGATQLLIYPGYGTQTVDALVTNFHQPESTLLLLVADLVGDAWEVIYQHALGSGYRFLSYGDASLLYNRNSPLNQV